MAAPDPSSSPLVHWLPENLWRPHGALGRSLELTPLYVDRYAGPRVKRAQARIEAHPHWELVFVFEGEGVHCGRPDHSLRRDTAVLIPPGVRHDESSDGHLDMLWVGLRGTRLDGLPRDAVIVVKAASGLRPWMERLWLANERRRALSGLEIDGIAVAVLGGFFHARESEIAEPSNHLDAALRFIQEHLASALSVAAIARHAGCSESFLHREFRCRLDRTPAAYLADARLARALRLMREIHLSANEAAVRVGFTDPRQFRRVCQRRRGCTPSEAVSRGSV